LQSILGVNAVGPLVAFYDIPGRKGEVVRNIIARFILIRKVKTMKIAQKDHAKINSCIKTIFVFAY
jgi:hypothetical protein